MTAKKDPNVPAQRTDSETTQDLTAKKNAPTTGADVEGANDPTISSRDKDALFGDAPKTAPGAPQFQEPPTGTDASRDVAQDAAPVPDQHAHGDYSDTEDYGDNVEADFDAPMRHPNEEDNA